MGKFDGYLICSDLDGTFRYEDSVAENSKAVKYFIENGGKFTFATGRSTEHLRNPEFFVNMNAPACICNGAVIYDYENEKILREERLSFTLREFLNKINEKEKIIRLAAFYSCVEDCIVNTDLDAFDDEILDTKLLKIVCVFEDVLKADEFKAKYMADDYFKDVYISKSWATGVEFNHHTATKGYGLLFLKKYLGNIHTAIGVGDYGNDMPLLECADIAVAPENATPEIKEKADLIVKHAKDCAIRDLIKKIGNEIHK